VLAVGIEEGGTIERAGCCLYSLQAGVWRAVSNAME